MHPFQRAHMPLEAMCAELNRQSQQLERLVEVSAPLAELQLQIGDEFDAQVGELLAVFERPAAAPPFASGIRI